MEFGGRGETVVDGGGGRSRQRDRRSQGRGGGEGGGGEVCERREIGIGENIRGERYGDAECRGLNEV